MQAGAGQGSMVRGGGETGSLGDIGTVRMAYRADIDGLNEELPSYKRIYRLVITDQPMIKTTTGKVKRYAETKTL